MEQKMPNTSFDFLYGIMASDVRVYKTRGTDPARDIGDLSHGSRSASANHIANGLSNFIKRFMPDGYFIQNLRQNMYQNQAVFLMLIELDEYTSGEEYGIDVLGNFTRKQITREHIIAQHPNFSLATHGFSDEDEFIVYKNQFGNLLPLTKSENSKCNNSPVHTKITDQNLYPSSIYRITRDFAHKYAKHVNSFSKQDIEERTEVLAKWASSKWIIW
ncbi:MAG: HNH endonuclease family protein [Spirochaetia bacterium]|nr:HNH endonuclease family protein [Spirochaetia bacterium]